MRTGQSADIVSSVGVLNAQLGDSLQAIILVVALWEQDQTPMVAVTEGFKAFSSELRAAITARLGALTGASEEDKEKAINEISEQVNKKVSKAILNVMVHWPQLLLRMDDFIGSDAMFLTGSDTKTLTELLVPGTRIPISLAFGGELGGRLLLYHDASQSGGGEVSSPTVIGQAGWADFKFLFASANQAIYAVEELRQVADRYEIEGHLEVR
jgi:uncharacterized protein YbjQ (UPF0145 family)